MLAKLLAISLIGIGVVGLIVGISALYAWPVQLLWNGVLVNAVDGVHKVSFLQAWGLTFLSGLLFKSTTIKEK